MNPRQVEMCNNRFEDRDRKIMIREIICCWSEVVSIEPLTGTVQQKFTVLWWNCFVSSNTYRVTANLARFDLFRKIQTFEDATVEVFDQNSRQPGWLAAHNFLQDPIAGVYNIVDLFGQILLRWWELQLSFKMFYYLLLGQRIPFYRRRRQSSLR